MKMLQKIVDYESLDFSPKMCIIDFIITKFEAYSVPTATLL